MFSSSDNVTKEYRSAITRNLMAFRTTLAVKMSGFFQIYTKQARQGRQPAASRRLRQGDARQAGRNPPRPAGDRDDDHGRGPRARRIVDAERLPALPRAMRLREGVRTSRNLEAGTRRRSSVPREHNDPDGRERQGEAGRGC